MNEELFAKRLKELRKLNKMSQKDLSELSGVDRTSICKYETGERKPTIDTLICFSRIFKVSINYLCGLIDTLNIEVDTLTYQKIMNYINNGYK